MQTTGGDPDVRRHGAVDPVAESFAVRTEVVAASPAQQAFAANRRGRLGDDAIAFAKALHGASGLRHGSGELVAENDRHIDGPGMRVVRLVHIGSADGYGAHPQQHVIVADVGHCDIA